MNPEVSSFKLSRSPEKLIDLTMIKILSLLLTQMSEPLKSAPDPVIVVVGREDFCQADQINKKALTVLLKPENKAFL